jgi:hypothetical protein
MNTNDLSSPVSASKLNETMYKKFGVKVNFNKYTREQLEDYRNVLRSKTYHAETQANFNSLLSDEIYQRDKYMLNMLNQKIKEMLGESIAELKQAIAERKLSPAEKAKKEKTVKKLKGQKFKGGEEEMYAVATNIAKGKKMNTKTKTKTNEGMEGHHLAHYHAQKCAEAYNEGMLEVAMHHKAECEKHGGSVSMGKGGCHHAHPKLNNGAPYECSGMWEGTMAEGKLPMKKGPNGKMVPAFAADGKGKNDLTKKKAKTEALDPVGKEDDDVDNDGKKNTKSDQYLKNRRAKVAAAIGKKKVKESLVQSVVRMINEDQEEKAKDVTAGIDMVNDFTSWMQRVGQYQTKSMIELSDSIKANFGPEMAEQFKSTIEGALQQAQDALRQARETISGAVTNLANEEAGADPMGMPPETGEEPMPGMPGEEPEMDMGGEDEFASSDAATSREMRETFVRESIYRGDRLMKILGTK